uniref:Uncharacterized protein n=1 Tax=Periophthalmus magnuspinnatus TaxID=409849 RepID=A0A3B4ALD6_9GOBI
VKALFQHWILVSYCDKAVSAPVTQIRQLTPRHTNRIENRAQDQKQCSVSMGLMQIPRPYSSNCLINYT